MPGQELSPGDVAKAILITVGAAVILAIVGATLNNWLAIGQMQTEHVLLKSDMQLRYTSEQASADKLSHQEGHREHQRELDSLTERVRTLEERVAELRTLVGLVLRVRPISPTQPTSTEEDDPVNLPSTRRPATK